MTGIVVGSAFELNELNRILTNQNLIELTKTLEVNLVHRTSRFYILDEESFRESRDTSQKMNLDISEHPGLPEETTALTKPRDIVTD